ncbi:hypothetical protein B0J12DRAFT_771120, partial [Macrophomina phaseolina]
LLASCVTWSSAGTSGWPVSGWERWAGHALGAMITPSPQIIVSGLFTSSSSPSVTRRAFDAARYDAPPRSSLASCRPFWVQEAAQSGIAAVTRRRLCAAVEQQSRLIQRFEWRSAQQCSGTCRVRGRGVRVQRERSVTRSASGYGREWALGRRLRCDCAGTQIRSQPGGARVAGDGDREQGEPAACAWPAQRRRQQQQQQHAARAAPSAVDSSRRSAASSGSGAIALPAWPPAAAGEQSARRSQLSPADLPHQGGPPLGLTSVPPARQAHRGWQARSGARGRSRRSAASSQQLAAAAPGQPAHRPRLR